jgi:hypothetical protein
LTHPNEAKATPEMDKAHLTSESQAKARPKNEQEAGGNAPRGKATRHRNAYEAERARSGACGSRRLAEEPRQGGGVGPDVSEKDEGLSSWLAIDGKALEVPALEGALRPSEALRAR